MKRLYKQLNLEDLRNIEDWWHAKVPVVEMARVLKRLPRNQSEFFQR